VPDGTGARSVETHCGSPLNGPAQPPTWLEVLDPDPSSKSKWATRAADADGPVRAKMENGRRDLRVMERTN
jgi:hypothetical protein